MATVRGHIMRVRTRSSNLATLLKAPFKNIRKISGLPPAAAVL